MRIPQSNLCIRGRAVKAADSKSAGVSPREFESHRMRKTFFYVKICGVSSVTFFVDIFTRRRGPDPPPKPLSN